METSGFTETTKMPTTNSTEWRNESEYLELNSEKAFSSISFGLGSVITVINIVSLTCLIRHRKCVMGTGFWQQLLFLCLSDILTGIGLSVFKLGFFLFNIHSDIYYTLCMVGIFSYPTSLTLSVGNCCLISIQRYISVRTLGQKRITWDKRKTVWMILSNIFICILTIVLSVVVITIHFGFHHEEFCSLINLSGQNYYKSQYVTGSLILYIVFFLCTNISTVLSIIKLYRNKESNLNSNSQSTRIFNIQLERNRYATKTFMLVVLVLNLTTIPSLLFLSISVISKVRMSAEITEILSRLMCVNSMLNPFIYSLRMVSFRNAVWNDVKALWNYLKCFRCTACCEIEG